MTFVLPRWGALETGPSEEWVIPIKIDPQELMFLCASRSVATFSFQHHMPVRERLADDQKHPFKLLADTESKTSILTTTIHAHSRSDLCWR